MIARLMFFFDRYDAVKADLAEAAWVVACAAYLRAHRKAPVKHLSRDVIQ